MDRANSGRPDYLAYEAKRILSRDPSIFRFSIGQRVRAPLYLGAKERIEGVILEGI